jgi:hypothetical protein
MTIPQSVAEILRKHATLEVEGIDRMYLNVYVPCLQIVETGPLRGPARPTAYRLNRRTDDLSPAPPATASDH